jgi:hypothetical protein
MERSELVEPRQHVRRGVKSASEDALRKGESIYSPGYSRTTILAPIGDAARGATDDAEGAGRKSSGKPSPWRRSKCPPGSSAIPSPRDPFGSDHHRAISRRPSTARYHSLSGDFCVPPAELACRFETRIAPMVTLGAGGAGTAEAVDRERGSRWSTAPLSRAPVSTVFWYLTGGTAR